MALNLLSSLPAAGNFTRLSLPLSSKVNGFVPPITRVQYPMAASTTSIKPVDQTIIRRSADYGPTIWSFDYIQSLDSKYKGESYARQLEKLKEQVSAMLQQDNKVVDLDPLHQLELIDNLHRLGVSYHFEDEIKRTLDRIHNKNTNKNLYATALKFRILRQYGYNTPVKETFSHFMDEKGSFKSSSHSDDCKGMLALYEAAYLLVEEESSIFRDAIGFTTAYLKEWVVKHDIDKNDDEYLCTLVKHALELPLHWRMRRLEARWFIDVYESGPDMNPILLELAKLDYNIVQAIHQEDLKYVSRWWMKTGLGEKLNFARDRVVENFFWTVGDIFEPQFGYCRRMSAMVNCLLTSIDDVYDVYGTLDELELFTDAVERWDATATEQLPYYMKLCFHALYNSVNEMGFIALRDQEVGMIIPYLKKAWADQCKSYLVEAKWYNSGYIPTLQEYMENAWISVTAPVMLLHAYAFTANPIRKEALEFLQDSPDIIRISSMIVRLEDDLGTSSDELKRGDVPKSIQCYMHETGVSEDEAREHIRDLIAETWMKMNSARFGNPPYLHGTAPHSAWRNYDDINEYFWSNRCFKSLKWPIDYGSNFFVTVSKGKRVGKTGFVEQRTFWNIFRSFDKLWVMLILFLQAAAIVAWTRTDYPWQALDSRDIQVELLTVFITWGGLRFLQSLLDAGTQYSLVSRETMLLGVRMVLKSVVALTWTVVFGVLYGRIWSQKNADGRWSYEANQRIIAFLKAVLVFIMPELLSIVLFVLPWIRNWIEELDWPIVYMLTWWFHSRIFVGRALREGLVNNFKYTVFWILVLLSKFSFSYFLQIKPLVAPTKALLNMKKVDYNWHEFFGSTNRVSVVLLWVPVILIYLMDLQIWYSIFSSIVGAVIGLFSHLGEIRNIGQLRLRFQFFASAMQFNLMPEEQLLSPKATLVKKLRDAIRRLKLRYGLGLAYNKIESSQVEATRFALLWNEIMLAFREEDLISDRELELLELQPNCWDIRVIRWPCILLCNELLLALSQATELADAPDRWLWLKICKNEYTRCAVIEAYDSIKYLLLAVVKYGTEENAIVTTFFTEIENYMQIGKFTEAYRMTVLPKMHANLISLVELMMKPEKDLSKAVNILQALYELSVREFPRVKRSISQLRQEGLAPRSSATDEGLLFENAVKFPGAEDAFFYRQLRRLHTILSSRDSMHNVPVNIEARRRIAFFGNSLFMNMPRAPYVEKMLAFSVLTPYYDEEVVFSKEMLRKENEDGVSILFYLQKIYADEWNNFMERMRREGMEDDDDIWSKKARDLRLWASYRGQTLSRTVRGMMYYYRALKMFAFLDSASEMDIRMGSQELASHGSLSRNSYSDGPGPASSKTLPSAESGVSLLFKGHECGSALMKFTYVVTCQVYGQQKAKGDSRAEEILYLLKNNEALRVAYVDEVHLGRDEVEYYSVLVKYDQLMQREVEIYRIRLPGPLKLGEGKPENQNHAIIFTRGDAVQTIDMNQDNYFEEALKMRNLLEEFNNYYGIRKPTILGVRENIFSGSVSSLASFMSAQETSFVTLGQRVLANPLKVRMHYGHPDVFDRFWFLPRGGISKASKVINISEDIFAGFNCTLRGGNVTHHEYIQVAKGKDVGLNQVSLFEAKVASGNGEQALSRDVYRLGHRLDFFRMLSFFYTSLGHYFNSLMVIITVYTFLWGRLYLALSGVEKAVKNSTNNKALSTLLNQQFLVQFGLFTALPMIVENSLEHGFLPAVWDFLTMQLQLASLFYTFSLGTRAHFFGRTILHGGAKYRATGRGFVVQHKSFSENYRLYSRSHFVKAIELGVILIVYAFHSPVAEDTFVYIAMSITSWFLVVSWMMSPFVFNPSGFDWLKTVYDFDDFIDWIWFRGVFTKADQSWETWWYEEQDHLRTTGLWGKLLEIILDLRFFFFQYGIVYQLGIAGGSTSIVVYLLSWIVMVVVVAIYITIAYAQNKYAAKDHIYYRLVQLLVIVLVVLVIVLLLEFTKFDFFDLVTSLLAFIPTGWGMILIAQVLRPFLQSTLVWDTVVSLARLYELLFGVIVMAPMALLSWLPGFQSMQTRILFNQAFSRGLQISRILTGKKSN